MAHHGARLVCYLKHTLERRKEGTPRKIEEHPGCNKKQRAGNTRTPTTVTDHGILEHICVCSTIDYFVIMWCNGTVRLSLGRM